MGMAKYDRLLFILNLLRARRNLNAGQIAVECEVTERTIYRDIISLSSANIPIYYDRGYKFASDNFLPTLNFTLDEYLALKTTLESSPLNNSPYHRSQLKNIKSKIEACLNPSVLEKKKYTTPTMAINIKSTIAKIGSEKLYAVIEEGIKNCNIVRLKYESIQSGLREREIDPYFLIFIEKAFYFVAYCHLRKEIRTFRIDRIVDAYVTETKFSPRKDISPAKYFEDSWGVFGGDSVEIKAIFSGKAARVIMMGQHHPREQVTPMNNGKAKYEVTVRGTEEICRWLIGFGGEVTVLAPPNLLMEIKKRAKEIINNYK
jgi:predicted DNA-binding transcriptional regulator YafY